VKERSNKGTNEYLWSRKGSEGKTNLKEARSRETKKNDNKLNEKQKKEENRAIGV